MPQQPLWKLLLAKQRYGGFEKGVPKVAPVIAGYYKELLAQLQGLILRDLTPGWVGFRRGRDWSVGPGGQRAAITPTLNLHIDLGTSQSRQDMSLSTSMFSMDTCTQVGERSLPWWP